jgi:uncharacterized membrane protein
MVRTALFGVAGLLLGLFIHLIVILTLPQVAENRMLRQIETLDALNKAALLKVPPPGQPNPLRLDPDLVYAVCRLDLSGGPGEVTGTLPASFWSLAVFDTSGTVLYSTTNRDGIGQSLDVGIFDPGQTRLLAEQKIDIAPGLLIVESRSNSVIVVVRLAPPHPTMRSRYESEIQRLACRNIRI